jgi:hypothetical protein
VNLGSGTNLRRDGDDWLAHFTDSDGVSYEARQIPHSTDWVVESNRPIEGIFTFGQSNAGFMFAPGQPIITATPFPHTVLKSQNGGIIGGAYRFSEKAVPFISLTSANERFLISGSLDAFAAEQIGRDNGRTPTGLYHFTQYEDGKAIFDFLPDTPKYVALLSNIRMATASAALYGRQFVVRAIIWQQGETDIFNKNDHYADELRQLIDGLQADIPKITGQHFLPQFMLRQVNGFQNNPTYWPVVRDQYLVAKERRYKGVTMIGPSYLGSVADHIHFTLSGRMIAADVTGVVLEKVRSEKVFVPLEPIRVVRNGATIDITFALPGGPLKLDRDIVPDTMNEGFVYSDSTDSASIRSVAVVSDDIVRIQLDRVPSGDNKVIRYALDNFGSPAHPFQTTVNYVGPRGTLYSQDSAKSVYARLKYPNVPEYARHYSVQFQMNVP